MSPSSLGPARPGDLRDRSAGFDTIGNATIIAYDRGPVLATDPWLGGGAYFGSWGLSHPIPAAQREAILACPYVWFSHGHPDHLSADSLPSLQGKTVLLPDHVGGRVRRDLEVAGFTVRVLPDYQWVRLSDRVRVLCIADYNQDAILLLEINGRLLVDQNDASDRGWGAFVKREVRRYPISFLLALSGYGDADMINFFDEQGVAVPPPAAQRRPVGADIQRMTENLGVRYFVPSSSMHRYQRSDSRWADQYTTRLQDYAVGFASTRSALLPPFLRYDCERDTYDQIEPAQAEEIWHAPEDFGDVWGDGLEADELRDARAYFRAIEHLGGLLDYLNLRVGGRDNVIELAPRRFQRGLTIEAPRQSLVSAVRYEVFDDLLIGNFARTTLHGTWPRSGLYPDFTPYVAKYGDNGRARSKAELDEYFAAYRRRMGVLRGFRHVFEERSKNLVRAHLSPESQVYQLSRRTYWAVKAVLG